jgi:predicted Zn-dependent protease
VTPEQRLAAFQKMVDQRPDEPFARYSLAMSYRSLGRADEAAREFEELLRRKPDYVPAYLMLGQTLEILGRMQDAARVYADGIVAAGEKKEEHARSELGQALEVLKAQGVR